MRAFDIRGAGSDRQLAKRKKDARRVGPEGLGLLPAAPGLAVIVLAGLIAWRAPVVRELAVSADH